MENKYPHDPLLELLDRPAFYVDSGIIQQANQAAHQKMITVGDPIGNYLDQDLPAYEAFSGGCLYLTLQIANIPCNANVLDVDGRHLFVLDALTEPQLQALSLAAQSLRMPMSNAFLAAELMKDRNHAEQINRSLTQMHRIVCNMADAYRYYERQDINLEATDLNSFFAEIMEKATTLVKESGIRLNYTALPQSIMGMADRQLLERAVLNLISNAVKFSGQSRGVEAKLTQKGHMLYFTVQDNGEGIPPQIQRTIFARYLRSPGVEDSRHGIGLGLSLVRSAAVNHGGTVLIDHPESGGTRVTMTLDLMPKQNELLRSPITIPTIDYAGGYDHGLLELSDVLPPHAYRK